MRRVVNVCCVGAVFLLLTSALAWAQATAQMSGQVTDDSGGVLPGVTVTVTQTDTGFSRTVVTDGTGIYVVTNLPTGPYQLEVSLQGFRTYVQTGVVLQVNAAPEINAMLGLGALEETVTVEAAAPLVDVQSAGLSEVITNEEVLALPLDGRNPAQLILLAGAAVQTGQSSSRSIAGGLALSVAGGLNFGVAYSLDGAMHNDPHNNLNLPLPFPDALQEFSVATSGLSANSGMHTGASVSAVTKSGANTFSGNVFEFYRDKRFNAPEHFARVGADGEQADDGLTRNQFGGTLGGPIVQDRVFFFVGYQGTRLSVEPTSNLAHVPTAAMLAGDYTAFASPACNSGRQINLRAPFVNNRIDPAQFSPAAVNLAARLPSSSDPCGELRYGIPTERKDGQVVSRIDYQMSNSQTLFGRYINTWDRLTPPIELTDNVLTTRVAGRSTMAQSMALGNTMVMGNNKVNSVRFVFNRSSVDRGSPDYFDPMALGIPVHSYNPGKLTLGVDDGFGISRGPASTGIFETNSYQVVEDLNMVRGSHQLAVGTNVAYWASDQFSHARSGGSWQFDGSATGLGLADLMVGRMSSLEHGGPAAVVMTNLYLAAYAQDAWRASDRVTVNYGVRWEPYFGQDMTNGTIANFSRERFDQGVGSSVFNNAPAGFYYPGDPDFPGKTGITKKWWNFSPRAGVAWDASGDGRTAVRASYSLGYDFQAGEFQLHQASGPPFGNFALIEDPPGGFDDPYGHIGGDPHPITTNADTEFVRFGNMGSFDPDLNAPRVQSWNFTIERQLGDVWQVEASYLGSYSDRLWNLLQLNLATDQGLGPCTLNTIEGPRSFRTCTGRTNVNERRVLFLQDPENGQFIGGLDHVVNTSEQSYRGLKLSVRRRSAGGVSLNGNYTLSRCWGHPTITGFGQQSSGYSDPNNQDADKGNCSGSRRHIANVTLGYLTPQFENGALRAVASDWRLSSSISARSGSWLNLVSGRQGSNGQRLQNRRVDQVSNDVYGPGADRSNFGGEPGERINNYLNRAAFAHPDYNRIGDYVYNSVQGPRFWTVNLAVSKRIGLGGGGQNLELRVEAFNLFDTFNWGNPSNRLSRGSFGRITSQAGDPRIMQFGAKIGF